MGRLIRWLFYLALLAGVGLIAYAYLAPLFGVSFSPSQHEIRMPVTLPGLTNG